ncbi:hypothetical protein Syun_012651 [Stephania yunnanensis]|uniref:Uncharacterized protein n=1 Tax=Stephania yunnanensis TaxID=152371 RepID=A0AAP0K006_9MAGN
MLSKKNSNCVDGVVPEEPGEGSENVRGEKSTSEMRSESETSEFLVMLSAFGSFLESGVMADCAAQFWEEMHRLGIVDGDEHKKNMRIIEKMKEIEAEMARTQKNKATVNSVALVMPFFDASLMSIARCAELSVLTLAICYNLRGNDPIQVGKFFPKFLKVVIAFSANWILAFVILVLLPLVGLNGYIQLKFMKGFSADAKGVLGGKYDDLSEQSFYMVGGIEEVIAKAEKIARRLLLNLLYVP